MKGSDDQIDHAKSLLMQHFADAPWFSGVGVGRVASGIGLVMMVRRGSRKVALKALGDLDLGVEVKVREVGPIRAR